MEAMFQDLRGPNNPRNCDNANKKDEKKIHSGPASVDVSSSLVEPLTCRSAVRHSWERLRRLFRQLAPARWKLTQVFAHIGQRCAREVLRRLGMLEL
jgi:hypothetical protein